jgi:hypothetical protein
MGFRRSFRQIPRTAIELEMKLWCWVSSLIAFVFSSYTHHHPCDSATKLWWLVETQNHLSMKKISDYPHLLFACLLHQFFCLQHQELWMITSIGAGKTNMAPCVFVWFLILKQSVIYIVWFLFSDVIQVSHIKLIYAKERDFVPRATIFSLFETHFFPMLSQALLRIFWSKETNLKLLLEIFVLREDSH